MDEQILFDRFHEALDVEPRPGAYERMRFAFASQPVALKRRPVKRMRFSKMGFRIAAVLAAAVIVIALVAVVLATHRAPVGYVPAGHDKNLEAYQTMIKSDYATFSASTSVQCQTIQDTGCAESVKPVVATLQKWANDVSAFNTPSQFVVLGAELSRHLNDAITDLNAAVALQKVKNEVGFNMAMVAATYERAWIDPVSFAIEGSYPRVAGSFPDAVSLARQSLNACATGTPAPADLGCAQLFGREDCSGAAARGCLSDVQSAEAQAETFLIGLAQNPAPAALASLDAQFETNLGRADAALLSINDALVSGDSAKSNAGQDSYKLAITAAQSNTVAIINS